MQSNNEVVFHYLQVKVLDYMLLQAAVRKRFAELVGAKYHAHVLFLLSFALSGCRMPCFYDIIIQYFPEKVFIRLIYVSYLFIKWRIRNG